MENCSSSINSSAKTKNEVISSDSIESSYSNNTAANSKNRATNESDSGAAVSVPGSAAGNDGESRFKGVVPQQNGNWGAQIYANHQRVWLGTFKSARLAAMAYDSAAIKLRSGDLHRNFPWTALTLQEPHFQAHYSADAVLAMIKDGSYQAKFEHFVRLRSMSSHTKQIVAVDDHLSPGHGVPANTIDFGKIRVWASDSALVASTRKLLFQKELTPSDVGKLNRLVIPKKYAVKYFPFISEENGDDPDDVELVFYDKNLAPWRFRYCYWKSSQSYVFTRGWNRFVKDHNLKANYVVTFYSCDTGNTGQSFCLIDATENDETKASENHVQGKGFRLFGVDIMS